jgi:hypothetical protein
MQIGDGQIQSVGVGVDTERNGTGDTDSTLAVSISQHDAIEIILVEVTDADLLGSFGRQEIACSATVNQDGDAMLTDGANEFDEWKDTEGRGMKAVRE